MAQRIVSVGATASICRVPRRSADGCLWDVCPLGCRSRPVRLHLGSVRSWWFRYIHHSSVTRIKAIGFSRNPLFSIFARFINHLTTLWSQAAPAPSIVPLIFLMGGWVESKLQVNVRVRSLPRPLVRRTALLLSTPASRPSPLVSAIPRL